MGKPSKYQLYMASAISVPREYAHCDYGELVENNQFLLTDRLAEFPQPSYDRLSGASFKVAKQDSACSNNAMRELQSGQIVACRHNLAH